MGRRREGRRQHCDCAEHPAVQPGSDLPISTLTFFFCVVASRLTPTSEFICFNFKWTWTTSYSSKTFIYFLRNGMPLDLAVTFNDINNDPVWRGVGGDAGVVAAEPGGGVSHCQPALGD